ncbi:leptin receptor precursor [Takifugu rubripes]|uniref:Leptin receptor n=1 Tax=Takifugu rubripes TaxID=31033 RepID=B3Y063_TAKRU|nr:leptin receptor precursor [Takifugu rubripes]BAG67079.1 leptin receptor [Takifugu rubripes]|eukprot:NP_001124341.1 leptin receptor precursor [Takifugu rubripes]
MSSTMFGRVTLSVMVLGFLLSRGVLSLENSDAGGRHSGVLDLPWKDELCCESRPASTVEGASAPAERPNGSNRSLPHDSQCSFKNLTSKLHPLEFSGTCLDILCGIDEKWENVTCHLEPHALPLSLPDAGHMAVSLQRRFQKSQSRVDSEEAASDPPVFCEAEDSFTCSVALDAESSFHAVVTVTIADARAPSVLLRVPARPVKPAPPVNLSHVQTIEAELILHWGDPKDIKTDLLQYEVRYSPDTIHPAWQVMSVSGDTKTSLDLKACVNYTVQVRRSSRSDPPLWSGWSESHHIFLDEVSYIPEKVVVKAGENVTVYCVFNDHNFNASTALWTLNFDQELDYSLYHPINQWVSQVTMRPSETGMYDLLQCTKKRMIAYSQVYVEGASISISCETNGEIDAMDCRWNSTQWLNPNFRTRWADLSCDVMEERERAGDNVGHEGPSCLQVDSRKRLCTIQPLRTNCYKLWLEVSSHLGLIRSKPVYLTPNDHVKPHTPTDVKAVSRSGGVLNVTWKRPYLPVEVQCQFRYHSPSADHPKPDWKVQAIVREPWAEVNVSDVCRVFVVQVRCMHISGAGYWSEWSPSVYSSPQNSRAPERGPNFWRFLQDDPHRKQTNVTLLFKDLQTSGQPYCVEGFLVKRLGSTGPVQEPILMQSSYSFEWNQMPQTVTVEAFNSLGSSSDNINMTLEKSPKRRCVHHFSVTVINSTCVSLSWTLIDKSSPPIFMVVQWSLLWKQDSGRPRGQSTDTWVRLPYTDGPTYLGGHFFGSEDYGFYLYPVFAHGEGEPAFATATRRDPAIYMMLMMISFLSIVLLISLILSQNQMKKLMWKDVPNPNQCSWARGIDLNAFDHMFHPPEGFPAWPLLLPPEKISNLVIVDKADLSALSTPPDPSVASSVRLHGEPDSPVGQAWPEESHLLPGGDRSSPPNLDYPTGSAPDDGSCPAGVTDSSAQSSVIYTAVLLCGPKQQQQHHHLHDKDCSCSSSSDEGNFSANNSDISASFNGGLWELDVPRRSCCYNSTEELSEKPEQGDRDVGEEKDLYYIGADYGDEDEESEEELNAKLIQTVPLNSEGCSAESRRLLELTESKCDFSPLYLPQFRTAPSCTRQLSAKPQEGRCHP